jgi:predicted porin
MEKQLLALVALCPPAGTVRAQSRVTPYGLIDIGFEALSNMRVTGKTAGSRQCRLDTTFGLHSPVGVERHRGSGRWSGRGIHT